MGSEKQDMHQSLRKISGLSVALLLLAAPARGGRLKAIESELNKVYKNQEMMQRVFYSGTRLRYAADGSLVNGGKPGSWTLDSTILCQSIRMRPKEVVIHGSRLYFAYHEQQKQLEPVRGPDATIAIAAGMLSISSVQESIAKVFVTGSEKPEAFVPAYWQPYFRSPTAPNQDPGVEKAKHVIPPKPLYTPNPGYTPEAFRVHIEGTVVLRVAIDTAGKVLSISIVKPLGMGLDDNAAETVRTWKFKPATRNGEPVSVKLMVGTTFRLLTLP